MVTPADARDLVSAIRTEVVGFAPSDLFLAVLGCLRVAHRLEELVGCHEGGLSESEADALRSILETAIVGRYLALERSDAFSRVFTSYERRRGKFADDFGRSREELDGFEEPPKGAKGLPDLKQMAERVDELDLPGEKYAAALTWYQILYGTLSDRHAHASPGALLRYSSGGDEDGVDLIATPDPAIDPQGMLDLAVGAAGVLFERTKDAMER